MTTVDSEPLARRLLQEEIERIVTEAANDGGTLRTGEHAVRLFATYPGAHRSVGHIVDALIAAAAARGVSVEITRGR